MSGTPYDVLLASFRIIRKLTQEELAARAEVSVRHIQELEAGRSLPSLVVSWKLAIALGTRPDVIWGSELYKRIGEAFKREVAT